jgi:fatty aldehyde-generating acyl-ACP reductase
MGSESSGLKFALIGHQESWENVMQFIQTIRFPGNNYDLTLEKVKDIFTYIPPRKIFDIEVNSSVYGKINGAYIETFISPDELDIKHLRKNIDKVKQACALCAKLDVPVASLGGFSSIVLEAGNESFTQIQNTFFTTGNTLTAAFITKGVEKACTYWQQPLSESKLLIIGSTGDIGSACTLYFSGKVKKLLLCARQAAALQKQSDNLTANGVANLGSIHLRELVYEADIIICVASSIINENDLDNIKNGVIVCDAGYPKNLQATHIKNHERLFYGGMGNVTGGYKFENNLETVFYKFPLETIGHGCLLEAIVLAMENKYCSFSNGKGNITLKAMKDILAIAYKHGVRIAPLFNKVLIDERATEKIL